MTSSPRIIVALDHPSAREATALISRLGRADYGVKVGKELFTREGPAFVRELVAAGRPVFLDLKFHDIPNTVAAACEAAAELGVWMINVHASGGRAMMLAAREALARHARRPLLVAVTVLTSLDAQGLQDIGITDTPEGQVRRLATLARDCGLDGVVCSPQEITQVKQACGEDFLTVTPGIRLADSAQDDQQRIATPASAVKAGGDHLVIGRPITRALDPVRALADIAREIASVGA